MAVDFKESVHGRFWVNNVLGFVVGQIARHADGKTHYFEAFDEDFEIEDLESIAAKLRELNKGAKTE